MKIELSEFEIEKIKEALYEQFCFDCDEEPIEGCPIKSLIEKLGMKCQWEKQEYEVG